MHSCLIEAGENPLHGAQIWTANLDALAPAEVDRLGQSLCASERARAAKFHFERDRRRYIATRGLLRGLIGSLIAQAPAAVGFAYGPHGKPALASRGEFVPDIQFNLSHAAGWAMFAVAREREVGIDLESEARLDRDEQHLSSLAAAVLTETELAIWQQLPNRGARRAALLRAWTRKEAYAKATGRGMSERFSGMEVALDAHKPETSLEIAARRGAGLTSGWSLHDLAAPAGFAASLAIELREN